MGKKPYVAVGLLAAAVLAIVAVAVVDRAPATAESTPSASAPPRTSANARARRIDEEKPTYASLLASTDRRIKNLQERSAARPKDWLVRQTLATALLDRAGLTNQIDDFERVQPVLDAAFAEAAEGSGPLEIAARYNFAIHRLDVAERFVEKMEARKIQKPEAKLAAHMLRAEIAMQRGDDETAEAMLLEVAASHPTAAAAELATYYRKTGKPDEAESYLESAYGASPKVDPRRRAWIRLQMARVAMERGRYREALERLKLAEDELPGWWMVEEHVGECWSALGDHAKALASAEKVLALTGLPQHMDTLAVAYQHAGKKAEAEALIAKATALWDDHMKRLPEASMGHGFAHVMQFGAPERALELARANFAARPSGEARVMLTKALLKNGRNDEALEVIEGALRTRYRTAALHDAASKTYAALGRTAEAEAARERCFEMNPFFQDLLHSH